MGALNVVAPGPQHTNADDSDDDDENEIECLSKSQRLDRDGKVRESDSIKRALADMNRQTQLLSNYVIMNSTGFIKIIKKFTKNFPQKKSEVKMIIENGFICGDGKRAQELSASMEYYYANWFCEGNETEARSHMLPKKGDGLDMDWSQLR